MKLIVNVARESEREFAAHLSAVPALRAVGDSPESAREHLSHAIHQCMAAIRAQQEIPVRPGTGGPGRQPHRAG